MATDPSLDASIDPKQLTDADWQVLLSPMEHAILREAATERPGTGPHLAEESPGAYHCAGCGHHLYDAQHKFHSGCGWPSFYQDSNHGMVRTEMRCARCDGHLGHVFQDAPQTPTGTRHCVNGHALIFVPQGTDPEQAVRTHRDRES